MMNNTYYKRNGEPSSYVKDDYKNIRDLDVIILLLEELDYPFIIKEWNQSANSYEGCFSKYINKMRLPAYARFGFKDSIIFNSPHDKEVNTLKFELKKDLYNKIVCQNKSDIESYKADKHIKGYVFDSLVYRFKDYQAKAFSIDVADYKYKHNSSELEARERVQSMHNRDLMRFIEILDEAIGEHD